MATLRVLLVGLAFVVFTGIYCHQQQAIQDSKELAQGGDTEYVQNVYEAQEKLAELGYHTGKIDGKWGPATDLAYANWCASRYFK